MAGAGAAASPKAAATPDKGTYNFVVIKKYLDANKSQAGKLGDQTAGIINQSGDQARSSLQGLNDAANQSIKPINSLSGDVSNKLMQGAESLTGDERNAVKQTANASYKGPKSVTDLADPYSKAQTDIQKAQQNVDNSGTEAGRMSLLGQVNSKPRTQGENVFDNALLQAGGGREKIAQASAQNQGLKGQFENAQTDITNRIGRADDPNTPDVDESSGAIGQTAKAQSDAQKKIQDAMNAWQSGFTPKVQQAQDQAKDTQTRIQNDLSDPSQLDSETLNLLGLQNGQRLYDVDLKNYLNQVGAGDFNAGNVASPEDYARYSALSDLAGISPTILNPDDAAKAGTAPKFSGNSKKLAEDLQQKEATYQNNYENARGGILNPNYTGNPGASQPYDGAIPGAITTRRDLSSATPKELEEFWIPQVFGPAASQYGGVYAQTLNAINKSLDDWKQSQFRNNQVTSAVKPGGLSDTSNQPVSRGK